MGFFNIVDFKCKVVSFIDYKCEILIVQILWANHLAPRIWRYRNFGFFDNFDGITLPCFRQMALVICPFSNELLHIIYAEKTILSPCAWQGLGASDRLILLRFHGWSLNLPREGLGCWLPPSLHGRVSQTIHLVFRLRLLPEAPINCC